MDSAVRRSRNQKCLECLKCAKMPKVEKFKRLHRLRGGYLRNLETLNIGGIAQFPALQTAGNPAPLSPDLGGERASYHRIDFPLS